MIWARNSKLFAKLGAVALALGALAISGNAQDALQGKFTLPSETHWGTTTLPAGDYTFTLPTNSVPYTFYIQGKGVGAIIVANTADEKTASGHSQLNLVEIGGVQTVETFEAPALGVTFTYATPKQKHMGRKEVHGKMAPQSAPATQTSENRTSIEVHTAGR